uniref:DUF1618 domain-containing protein n=1 Tax=Macrostomum lignano TaxID=282301 RepID=A0A1I8FKH0_9PLAT
MDDPLALGDYLVVGAATSHHRLALHSDLWSLLFWPAGTMTWPAGGPVAVNMSNIEQQASWAWPAQPLPKGVAVLCLRILRRSVRASSCWGTPSSRCTAELYGGVLIPPAGLLIDNKYLALLGLLAAPRCTPFLWDPTRNGEFLYFSVHRQRDPPWQLDLRPGGPDAFKMMRPITDPEVPWLGISAWRLHSVRLYFCTDQVLVQRILACQATSLTPGWHSHGRHPEDPAFCSFMNLRPAWWREFSSRDVMPTIVKRPDGVSTLLAALMSFLDVDIFNSAGHPVTVGHLAEVPPHANNKEQMLPINSFLAPPAVRLALLMAVMWTRMHERARAPSAGPCRRGSVWCGVPRMIWSFIESPPGCALVVSLVTRPCPRERLVGTNNLALRSNEEHPSHPLTRPKFPRHARPWQAEASRIEGSASRDCENHLIHVFCGANEVEDQLDESVREAIRAQDDGHSFPS